MVLHQDIPLPFEKSKHLFAGKMGQVAKVGWYPNPDSTGPGIWAWLWITGVDHLELLPAFLFTLMVTKCSEQENKTSLQSS